MVKGAIPDGYDLKSPYVANDLAEMFFRLDVYGTSTLNRKFIG